jgi:hypothetical protein
MFVRFDHRAGVMEAPQQTSARAGRSRALARLPVSEFLRQEERELALLYPIDRFSQGALEIATLAAVVTLFVGALV